MSKVTIHYLVASSLLVISFAVCLYRVNILSLIYVNSKYEFHIFLNILFNFSMAKKYFLSNYIFNQIYFFRKGYLLHFVELVFNIHDNFYGWFCWINFLLSIYVTNIFITLSYFYFYKSFRLFFNLADYLYGCFLYETNSPY